MDYCRSAVSDLNRSFADRAAVTAAADRAETSEAAVDRAANTSAAVVDKPEQAAVDRSVDISAAAAAAALAAVILASFGRGSACPIPLEQPVWSNVPAIAFSSRLIDYFLVVSVETWIDANL